MANQVKRNFDVRKVLNVQHFEKLTKIFKSYRNEDGSEGFPLEKFKEVFGQVLEGELNDDQLTSLFMKIDANSDGTVVFEEFSSFVLASSSQKQEHQGHLEIALDRSNLSSYVTYLNHFDKNALAVVCLDGNLLLYDLETKMVKNNTHLQKPNLSCWISGISIPANNMMIYITDGRSIHIVDLSSAKLTHLCQISDLPSSPTCLTTFIQDDTLNIFFGTCLGKVWRIKTRLSKFYLSIKELGLLSFTFSDIENRKDLLFNLMFAYCGTSWSHTLEYLCELKLVLYFEMLAEAPYFATLVSVDADNEPIKLALKGNPVCFDFSPIFNILGIATRDNNIYLFNSFIWRNSISCLTGHRSDIIAFKIHPSSPFCYSLSSDLEFRIWTLYDGQTLHYIQYGMLDINIQVKNAALFVSNNIYLGFRDVRLFNTTQNGVNQESTHKSYCTVKFNKSFHQVVSCGDNVRVFDIETGNEIFKYCDVHLEEVRIFVFDNTGRRLITASTDGTVKIWNFNNGQLLKVCTLPAKLEVRHLYYWHNDTQGIICTGNSGIIYRFDDDPDEELTDKCSFLEFAPNSEISFSLCHEDIIMFGTFSNKLFTYNTKTFQIESTNLNFAFPVTSAVLYNYNGKTNVCTAHSDGSLTLSKLSFEIIETCKLNLKKREVITHICDAHQLVVSTSLGRLQIIDKQSLSLLIHITAHTHSITAVEHCHDFYITSCIKGKVKIWTNDFKLVGIFGKNLWDLSNLNTIQSDVLEVKNKISEDLDNWRNLITNIKCDGDVLKEYRKNRLSKKYGNKWIKFVHRRRLIKTVHLNSELIEYRVDSHFKVLISSVPKSKLSDINRNRIYQHMTIAELATINKI
eukprot:NODE_372_length_9892_cov_0.272644.p2 type:complete len:855 gc:universal NODE_372_length_9892_cov_0.272644:5224-2660(-)